MKNIDDKENLGFDRLVKSILDEAAETVPEGVWEAVSGRLAARRKALLWRRMSVAVASVAAAAALAFVLIRPDGRGLVRGGETDATAESGAETSIQNTYADFSAKEGGETIAEATPSLENRREDAVTERLAFVPSGSGKGSAAESHEAAGNGSGSATEGEDTAVGGKGFEETVEPVKDKGAEADISGVTAGSTEVSNAANAEEGREKAANREKTAEKADAGTGAQGYVKDPFAVADATLKKRTDRPVSIKAGGSLMTNGNPSSLTYRTLSRPDAQSSGGPLITQTSKDASYSVPVSIGIGVDVPLKGRWSVESGVSYSFLARTFRGTYTDYSSDEDKTINADIRHSVHYVGIPLNICYGLVEGRSVSLRAHAGVEVEKAVQERFRVPDGDNEIRVGQQTGGVQLSAAAGFSVDFKIGKVVGIYFDPSLQYFFDCEQPVSIRTQQPLQMGFDLGLRFNL